MDQTAHDLLTAMLTPERERRLGCSRDGVREIKAHPYFRQTDWAALMRKEVAGPLQLGSSREGRGPPAADSPTSLLSSCRTTPDRRRQRAWTCSRWVERWQALP